LVSALAWYFSQTDLWSAPPVPAGVARDASDGAKCDSFFEARSANRWSVAFSQSFDSTNFPVLEVVFSP
jgi:hypothetical protein